MGTKPFVVIGIDPEDDPVNLLVFLCTIGWFRTVMLVISAHVDAEDFAEGLDILPVVQLMDCV